MGMEWLKGIVGTTDGLQQQWTSPYATPPGAPPSGAPGAAGAPGMPGMPGSPPPAYAPYATGAPVPPVVQPLGGAELRVATLEARCDELKRDVESLALFARTLLTLLVEKNVVTRDQFVEAKNKIDALDGKVDDRAGA